MRGNGLGETTSAGGYCHVKLDAAAARPLADRV